MNTQLIARETLEALARGSYLAPSGTVISIAQLMRACVDGTECHRPEELVQIREQVLSQAAEADAASIEVVNRTTLHESERLFETQQYRRIGVLNFASAKKPGGGFLGGAKAQEESLARSSGLYESLIRCPGYYSFNRAQGTCLYSDWTIYSPGCPVLRRDDGSWLEKPYLVDFVTSPAPNAGAIRRNEPHNSAQIEPVLRERSGKVLALAASHGCDALVLGAWGCGVFRNDPRTVASIFREHLGPGGPYWGRFRKVLFAVLDRPPEQGNYRAFAEAFEGLT